MNKVKFLVAALLGVLFVACSEEENLSQTGKTGFLVSLAEDVKVESRSTPEELGEPVASQFNLKITNQVTGSELYNGSYTNKLIPASAGTYAIEATHGENQLLAVDAPYYKGTAEAELADGESKTVNVKCKVANALASVVFSDGGALKFEDQFSKCELNVLVAGDSALIDGVKSAYYRAGSTPTFEFRGILKDGGEEVVQTLTDDKFSDPATFAAGAHCVITLKIGAVEPGVKIEITKVEVKEVTVSETIPMEWLPKPKVTAEGFTDNTLSMYETETPTAKFNFNLSSALQELKFTLNLADETYQSLNKTYTLSELSEEDRTALTNAGIILPVIGFKEASLDFTGLTAKLTGSTTGEVLSNVITLDEVKANNRTLEGEQVYTIQTSAPEFNLVVYPGNTWTRQFTANSQVTHGNVSVISKGLTYEYRTVDGEWTSSLDSIITELTPKTAYKVRGKYGDHYTEEVEVTTYPVIELENGGLEGGTITKGNDSNGSQYGAVYSWSGWCTLNELTCDDTHAFIWGNTAFNSRSGTRPATAREGSNGSASAWIMTMGYGYGGTSGPEIITPSELFLGTLTNVNHSEDTATKNYGIVHKSRPTGLRFYYKYTPYNGDSSDIYIQLKGINGEILGSASLNETSSVSSFKEITLDIDYVDEYKELEPETLVIVFKSGFNSDVKDYETWSLMGSNSAEPSHRGSELYIDDVELVYDK
ncbi:DUF4493 domain-containing protein [Bacteroides gallinaceum]|uniref:DUF4493 domain-containing protein n=1 Tax=Bacteroides gallinaceum TaxID=1462571 RepID=A0ABT7X643_9BACE|nr:DUF4493 domain-containing protein [Bacteroides gallinaceum]MDN0049556.1 DUF4493 domain-containing protein [Bacteroides gallinaceum]